jgi:hypothetical protein
MRTVLGRRSRAAALAGALCLVGLTALLGWQLLGSAGPAEAAAPKPPPTDALELILRLGDLPRGYELIDGSPNAGVGGLMCDRIHPANTEAKVDDFITRNKPAGCLALYYRTYRGPGVPPAPLVVGTGAIRVASADGATEGLAAARQLLSHALDDEMPEEVAPPAVVGEATRLFHWRHGQLFGEGEQTASFLVWRSGAVDAAVLVSGGKAAADDRAAVELAQRQQVRIENPTAAQPADFDDSEVALDNPGLRVPVYWLGKTFEPGHGLPPMVLEASSAGTSRAARIPKVGLAYADHPLRSRHEGLFVNAYSTQQWKRLQARDRRLPASLTCGATVRKLKVPGGTALVFHGKEKLLGRCHKDERAAWTLRMHLHGLVFTAETIEVCDVCAEAGRGPYDSVRGMAAIARGLVRREPPVSP